MRTYVRIVIVVLILSGCFLSLQAGPSAGKIKIIVPQANVYLKPNAESVVILQVPAGAILTGDRYDETWYKTTLPPDKDGFAATGFLKAADVEIYSEEKPVVKEAAPPIPEKREPEKIRPTPDILRPSSDQAAGGSDKGFFLALQGSFFSLSQLGDTSFTRVPTTYSFMNTIRDDGVLQPTAKASSFGGEFALGFFISDKFGIGLSAGYLPVRNIDLLSSYTFSWRFGSSGSVNTDKKNWDSTGTVSSMPISLDFYLRLRLAARSFLVLRAGPTLFLTKTALAANTGYGVALQSSYIIYPYIYTVTYVDWFKLDIENNLQKTAFGFNAGLEFEQRISPNIGIVLSGRYYFAPTQSTTWTLIPASRYDGAFGNLYQTSLPTLTTITTDIKFSFLSVSFGVRIHL
jgi:hypothetical protein